jgi:putative NIF3 family GTP cyclohydrolase 1 type 2
MKIKEIISILTKAIPIGDSWVQECYGAYNIKNMEKDVKKILYCVTATNEVVRYFKKNGYDLLISHHPFVVNVPQLVFHTALDCCKNGLNDMWANTLAVKNAVHFDRNLGWAGSIEKTSFEALTAKIEAFIGHKIKGVKYSTGEQISSVVICTGLGGMVIDQAAESKADCYITGELFSSSVKEYGFKAVIEVGHTLTEFMGVDLFRSLLPALQIDSAPLEIDYFNFETSIGDYPAANRGHIF